MHLNRSARCYQIAALAATSLVLCHFATGVPRLRASDEDNTKTLVQTPRLFELRTYTAAPGKLDALNKRFREHTNALFKKHGITIIGFWTPADEPRSKDTLIYILAYPSREAREKAWKEFQGDPDWVKVEAESEKDGLLLAHPPESVFMNPTDYPPIK